MNRFYAHVCDSVACGWCKLGATVCDGIAGKWLLLSVKKESMPKSFQESSLTATSSLSSSSSAMTSKSFGTAMSSKVLKH